LKELKWSQLAGALLLNAPSEGFSTVQTMGPTSIRRNTMSKSKAKSVVVEPVEAVKGKPKSKGLLAREAKEAAPVARFKGEVPVSIPAIVEAVVQGNNLVAEPKAGKTTNTPKAQPKVTAGKDKRDD
jgi:hypothetical protein